MHSNLSVGYYDYPPSEQSQIRAIVKVRVSGQEKNGVNLGFVPPSLKIQSAKFDAIFILEAIFNGLLGSVILAQCRRIPSPRGLLQ